VRIKPAYIFDNQHIKMAKFINAFNAEKEIASTIATYYVC